MDFIINNKRKNFRIIDILKVEEGLILRGGCAVAFMVILAIGTFIGIIMGFVSGDWGLFYGCGGLLALNLIINGIIYAVNKGKEKRYYDSLYKDYYKNIDYQDIGEKYKKVSQQIEEDYSEENELIDDPKKYYFEEQIDNNSLENSTKIEALNNTISEIEKDDNTNIYCTQCGILLPKVAVYCMKCGNKVQKY